MHQLEKIQLTVLTEEQAKIAQDAADRIYANASDFIKGLSNEKELKGIILRAFDAIEEIITSRKEPDFPTNREAIKAVLDTHDDLERLIRTNPNSEIAYDALFDFIKAGRVVSFKEGAEILTALGAEGLRDLAIKETKNPTQRG